MSYSTMQAMAGQQQLQHSEPTPVQTRLRSLVQGLEWSYVALWSLNPQTRKLGWKGGHWRHSDTQGWNHEQYFSSTFKSGQFRTGFGSVGMAYAKGVNTWMRGSSFLDRAGFKEQSQFLQQARISTAIFIPWSDGVLELGTCDDLPENHILMERIQNYFLTSVLPTLGQQGSDHSQLSASNMQTGGVVPQAPLSLPQSSRAMMQPNSYAPLSPLRHHLPDNLSTQAFEHNSLNQQIHRRLASMPNMFLVDAEGNEVMNTDNMLLPVVDVATARAASWGMPTFTTGAGALQTQQTPNQMYYSSVQPRTQPGQSYRSRSATTSSSVSSLEEAASTLLSGDSPEQNVFFSQRQPSHSNTSSSPRRGTSSHSPELNQLEDTIGCQSLPETQETRVEDDLNLDPFLMLEGEPLESGTYSFPSLETGTMSQMNQLLTESINGNQNQSQNQSPNHGKNVFYGTSSYELQQSRQSRPTPAPTQGPFKIWKNTRILATPLQKKSRQDLLRRCIDMVKQIPHSNPPTGPEGVQNEVQAGMQGRGVASSSSPETVIDGIPNDSCFGQVPPRGQRRPRQNSRISSMGGAVHQGHDEAAMNHMMAERRRRVKQKENFAALRRLVPIISKADKASILGDAIVYLKGLQSQIEELEVSKAESERKFETLQNSYKELEQRNKEIESMMRPTRLHSI